MAVTVTARGDGRNPNVRVTFLNDLLGQPWREVELVLDHVSHIENEGYQLLELRGYLCSGRLEQSPATPPTPATVYVVDLHGTLISRTLNDESLLALSGMLNTTENIVSAVYRRYEPPFDAGALSVSEFWRHIIRATGNTYSRSLALQCQRVVSESVHPLPWARELLDRLLARGKVVIATNTKMPVIEILHTRFADMFGTASAPRDGLTLVSSCRINHLKPSHEFMRVVRERVLEAGADPGARVLWIDDSTEALEAAQEHGYLPVEHRTCRLTWREVRSIESKRLADLHQPETADSAADVGADIGAKDSTALTTDAYVARVVEKLKHEIADHLRAILKDHEDKLPRRVSITAGRKPDGKGKA